MKRKIQLRDTDATGVVYFTELLRLAQETASDLLSIREMIEKEDFITPIVHAEVDYFFPLKVGDEVDIVTKVEKVGTTSFTLGFSFFGSKKREMAKASIIHVVIRKKTGIPIPIPKRILRAFHLLDRAAKAK
jgi:1,4-dihydroxy-2-naphthoyl-CoA hydrolase